MVKEQQMRWTPRGARLLLQVRTHVLNDQFAGDFRASAPASTSAGSSGAHGGASPALSRSPATAVAYLPEQKPEVYQGCGSTSLTH
jgi:hypothetical protein